MVSAWPICIKHNSGREREYEGVEVVFIYVLLQDHTLFLYLENLAATMIWLMVLSFIGTRGKTG
jgi:hypothetical protein